MLDRIKAWVRDWVEEPHSHCWQRFGAETHLAVRGDWMIRYPVIECAVCGIRSVDYEHELERHAR